MSYIRVIPRDLFNESKLLKCMGLIALNVLDGKLPGCELTHHVDQGNQFDIEQDEADGGLFLANVTFAVRGQVIPLKTCLNSRRAFPLVAIVGGTEIDVFDDDGTFTGEALQLFAF